MRVFNRSDHSAKISQVSLAELMSIPNVISRPFLSIQFLSSKSLGKLVEACTFRTLGGYSWPYFLPPFGGFARYNLAQKFSTQFGSTLHLGFQSPPGSFYFK